MRTPLGLIFQLRRFIDALFQFPYSYRFIREHRLWEGFLRYGWVTVLLVLSGALTGLQLLSDIWEWLASVGAQVIAPDTPGDFAQQQKGLAITGSFKYLTLILVEIIIFHSVNRAIQIQRRLPIEAPTFQQFLRAQLRMIGVSLRSWFKEIAATALISALCGLLGLGGLKIVLVFFVQAYYVGFAMLDNYNERLGLSIKESAILTRRFADVALGVGMVVYGILLLPVIGTLLGPLLGGVTATLLLHRYIDPDQNAEYDYQPLDD